MVRHFEVGQGDHRLDAVFQQFVEQIVVKLQAGLVRRRFVAVREDARPGDRGAEAFEAHLGEQRHVLLIAAVEIHRFVVRVAIAVEHAVGHHAIHAVRAAGQHVGDAGPFAAPIPTAFNLVRGDRAPPQKILRQLFHRQCLIGLFNEG